MSYVDLEIAFGVLPWDNTTLDVATNWTAIPGSDVRAGEYETSKRSDRFNTFSAGSAMWTLDNRLRIYDDAFNPSTGAATFDVTGGALEDLWTLASHTFAVGDRVTFSAVGTGAEPYLVDTDYHVVTVNDANTFQLSATLNGAVLAGTGSDSSGTWTIGRVNHFGNFKRNTPTRVIGKHAIGAATFDVTGGASEDLWTLTAHGMAVGQRIQFSAVGTGAEGYAVDTDYYVVAAADANTFQLSATLGGAVLAGTGSDSSGTWTVTRMECQWYGYVTSWQVQQQDAFESVTVAQCVDGLGLLAQYDLAPITSAHAGDTAGARIGRVLDDFGHPSSYRELDVGTDLLATTFGENALRHIAKVADSDGGFFYAQRDGTLVFDSLIALTDTRQTTSQVTLSHDTNPRYLALRRAAVGRGFRDLVRIGRTGGTVQEVDGSAANAAPVVYQRTSQLMNRDAKALSLANFYSDLYGTEASHINRVDFLYNTVNAPAHNSELFMRKLRDRVTAEVEPVGAAPDVSNQLYIDGIRGRFGGGRWTGSFTLSSADAYDNNLSAAPSAWMILGTVTTSELAVGKLGY